MVPIIGCSGSEFIPAHAGSLWRPHPAKGARSRDSRVDDLRWFFWRSGAV